MRPEILDGELGGSPLARAALSGDHTAAEWFARRPSTVAQWKSRVQAVQRRFHGRGWFEPLSVAIDAHGPAAERIVRVASEGGVLVTTGQQPGLFGGPLYTWVKALSALAFADEIERTTGVPAAPLFWAATDDADYAEAASTWISTPNGGRQLGLPDIDVHGIPMAEVPLPAEVAGLLADLRQASGSISDPRPLVAAERAWREGETIGDAYVRMLRELLHPLGIPVLDASHPSVRSAMDPLMRRALESAGEIQSSLQQRDSAIVGAGFRPQVALVEDLSLVFESQTDGKERIPVRTAAERGDLAEIGSLGPNVLLRPLAEQAMLPTVAYAAGPGETAYFAQVSAVAEALEEPTPLVLPRYSVTLVEPHVRAALDALGLSPDDLLDPHAPERRLAREAVSGELAAELAGLRGSIRDRMSRLERISAQSTPDGNGVPPEAVFKGAARQLEHRMDRLERRVAAAAARGDLGTRRSLAMVRGALVPGGARQERALNLLPLLARHGSVLLAEIGEAARPHARRCMGLPVAESPRARSVASSVG